MEKPPQHDCNVIATRRNTQPRKRLHYQTPQECFYANGSALHFKVDSRPLLDDELRITHEAAHLLAAR